MSFSSWAGWPITRTRRIFLDVLFHSGNDDNIGEYTNSRIDAQLESARQETDAGKRMGMYQQIEQELVDDAACLPLFFFTNRVLVKPYVKGFVPAPMPISWLRYIYLEPVK